MRDYWICNQWYCAMNLYKLPPFEPVTKEQMRRLWIQHRDPDIRRLILEVERYRRTITEIDRLYKTVHRRWREEQGSDLVALHIFKKLMWAETHRAPE